MVAWSDVARETGTWTDIDRNLEGGDIFLIQENGDFLFQENGDKILLEQVAASWSEIARTTGTWSDVALP